MADPTGIEKFNMKKIISSIAIATVALISGRAVAADNEVEVRPSVLTVNLTNGETERYKLVDAPVVTMADSEIVIKSSTVEGTYPFDTVSYFSFEKDSDDSGVGSAMPADASFEFTYVDNATVTVVAEGLEWVNVYSVAGTQVAYQPAYNGVATVDISHVAPGVYVVAPSCHSSIKIVKH